MRIGGWSRRWPITPSACKRTIASSASIQRRRGGRSPRRSRLAGSLLGRSRPRRLPASRERRQTGPPFAAGWKTLEAMIFLQAEGVIGHRLDQPPIRMGQLKLPSPILDERKERKESNRPACQHAVRRQGERLGQQRRRARAGGGRSLSRRSRRRRRGQRRRLQTRRNRPEKRMLDRRGGRLPKQKTTDCNCGKRHHGTSLCVRDRPLWYGKTPRRKSRGAAALQAARPARTRRRAPSLAGSKNFEPRLTAAFAAGGGLHVFPIGRVPQGQTPANSIGQHAEFLLRTRHGVGGVELIELHVRRFVVPKSQFDRFQHGLRHGIAPSTMRSNLNRQHLFPNSNRDLARRSRTATGVRAKPTPTGACTTAVSTSRHAPGVPKHPKSKYRINKEHHVQN